MVPTREVAKVLRKFWGEFDVKVCFCLICGFQVSVQGLTAELCVFVGLMHFSSAASQMVTTTSAGVVFVDLAATAVVVRYTSRKTVITSKRQL